MALARAFRRAGGILQGVIARTQASADRAARQLAADGRTLESVWPVCDLLILAVPDDRIAAVARRLARRTRCRFVFHLSGALAAAILSPLSKAGAAAASLHPLRAFSGGEEDDWEGTLVAIEGDPAAVELGERLIARLGATAYRIPSEAKPLYHAAATLAAGGTMALLAVAVRAACAAGVPESRARPALARLAAEAATATATRPFAEAFTGPIARRDAETVRSHRIAAARDPGFFDLYRRLAEEILASTPGRGRERVIRAILEDGGKKTPRQSPRARRR